MPAAPYQFDFSGGALCLDFVNTLGDRPRAAEEHLGDWRHLIAWGEQAHLLTSREAAADRASAQAHPVVTDRAFARARALREHIYRLCSAQAAGQTPAREDLAAFNDALGAAMAESRIEPRDGGFVWGWNAPTGVFDRVLWPVLRSAGDLLVSAARDDIRECASGTCSWLFIDRSPARRRRWCSMKGCGNRDKVRRFHERRRQARSA